MDNIEAKPMTLDDLATMVAKGFIDVEHRIDGAVSELREEINAKLGSVDKRIGNLTYKVDQLDAKLESQREETKAGFASLQAILGAHTHTITDHEERLRALEGE